MSVTQDEIDRVYEVFEGVPDMSHRKMMGGASFYSDGQIFAIIASWGAIYLKASGDFAATLEAEGSEKFSMEDGRSMNYWTLPEAALDDPDAARDWAMRALAAL